MSRSPVPFAGYLRPSTALILVSVVASVVMGFSFRIIPMVPGLEPSWVYGFNRAADQHLQWGRQFISTFGPYGYLIATMDLGNLVWGRLVFSWLLAVGFGIAASVYLSGVAGLRPVERLALLLAMVYAFSIQDAEYGCLVFFLLVFLTGFLCDGRAGLIVYAVAGLLGGFFLLVKFSLGLAAVATLFLGCCFVRRPLIGVRRLPVAALAVTGGLLIGWASTGSGLGGIGAYLTTAWEVSRGYSSAMSFSEARWWIDAISYLIWFAFLGAWVLVQRGPRNRLVLAGLAFPLFVAWKHSIVRQDMHVTILARFGVFVIAVLLAETVPTWRWRSTLPAVGVLLVPLLLPWTTMTARVHALDPYDMAVSPLPFRGLKGLSRLAHLTTYREEIARTSERALRERLLSPSMKSQIGQASVDVYPWDAGFVVANRLSWVSRPLPASFSGYTPALDGLNAAFFRSPARPEYVIVHTDAPGLESVNNRYLLWDEPQTVRAIVERYEVVEADADVTLLRALRSPRFGASRPLGTSQTTWHTWVTVPDSRGVLLATPALEPSFVLRIVRLVFREDPVFLIMWFSSGPPRIYRLVVDNMGSGLWLSPFATAADLPGLFRDGTGQRVAAIRFHGGMLARALSPSITVAWSEWLPLDAPPAEAR